MSSLLPAAKYSIVILGGGGVGKSAITLNFVRNQYDPTIEDCYCKTFIMDGMEYSLDITDTAGQEEYRGLFDDKFMRQGDGFVCVYSISSQDSLEELATIIHQIRRAKEGTSCPIIVVGNKCDLEQEREVSTVQGETFAQQSKTLFLETSAKTRVNIDETFEQIVREIRRQEAVAAATSKSTPQSPNSQSKTKSSCCCIA
ncbi:ras-like protein rasB [Basidiobolus meristosporus CBS 931.73]|uniref:Ras-like protein rasB n=1 Tax=Basidiobolus meristosporus CBS 931.73 TaxID=1314790 RepID=A0A1Y1Z6E6_9FUNG|nr:ras-like protein rasB [Basidiobolus meristosporus CBS 931.73]|eukprot:ORY05872.1 ras-like protein rasB [Basidiobolus meristosporus CBS 931.73]